MAGDNNIQHRSTKNEALTALNAIRDKYPLISLDSIERFAPVYYPIAMVEMDLTERTFENFEAVQLTVLKMVNLGQRDHRIIAETLGLSPNYVYKVLHLLEGYGHIANGNITPLGLQSVQKGQKIVERRTSQKFQVDALNGTLLKFDESVTDSMLNNKEQTDLFVGHLDYMDGMPLQEINAQLSSNCTDYIRQKSGILHTNVSDVTNARCLEVKYAKCHLIKFYSHAEPVILAKRYDCRQKDIKERFSWQPFCLYDKTLITRYGFEEELPSAKPLAQKYVRNLYSMLAGRLQQLYNSPERWAEEIRKAVSRVYRFEEAALSFNRIFDLADPSVFITENAFSLFRGWIIDFLLAIHSDQRCPITTERLCGQLVSLKTESEKLLSLAELLAAKVAQYGKIEIKKFVRERFKDWDEPGLIDALTAELQSMK